MNIQKIFRRLKIAALTLCCSPGPGRDRQSGGWCR